MYEYLQGKLVEKTATRAVLDVHGIGFDVRIPVSTFSKLPALGEPVRLLTHFIVREDAHQLFGFFSPEEREVFRLLISVSGIGPKLGMMMLSGMTIQELKQAITQGSVEALCTIPGIGKKTAERVVLELREKVSLDEAERSVLSGSISPQDTMMNDSLQALLELGYKKPAAKAALQKSLKEMESSSQKITVQELIRKALKYA